MLSVSNLSVSYGSIAAVRNVGFSVPEGSLVALIGANGAGKSSTLNAIAGLVRARTGSIVLDGEPVANRQPYWLVRKGLVLVPEGRMVVPGLTVWENLRHCRKRQTPVREFDEIVAKVYGMFPVLHDRRDQRAGSLSGGEQQMLAIGRALATQPRVLLLDEPSMGLAPAIIDTVFGAILEIHRNGQTIVLVEQNAELALEACDYALVLQRGEISAQGTPAELRNSPELLTAFLG